MRLYGIDIDCTQFVSRQFCLLGILLLLLIGCRSNVKTSYEPTAVSTLTTNERQKIPQRPLPIIRMTNVLAIPTTQSVTPSPTILPAAINRDCITPSFSEYARNARSKMQLPTPSAGRQSHFRFNAPMQVEGGLRINTIYPYGYDAGEDAGLLIHVGMDEIGRAHV